MIACDNFGFDFLSCQIVRNFAVERLHFPFKNEQKIGIWLVVFAAAGLASRLLLIGNGTYFKVLFQRKMWPHAL